jgi:hypothetical protein
VGDEVPSHGALTKLFAKARSARVLTVHGGERLVELRKDELEELREALAIHEGEPPFHCMCAGTLVIDLRGLLGSIGRITYHHGMSVRMSSWGSDARLVHGPRLLELLAARGIQEPLRAYERERAAAQVALEAREQWEAATPALLRPLLLELETGPMGLPRRWSPADVDRALSHVAPGEADEVIAGVLFRWLSMGRGPWSGYASYEETPMELLRGLPSDAVLRAALDPTHDDATLAAIARHYAAHEMVSFRKRVLADVPEVLFTRARAIVARTGTEDDLARLDHAIAVSAQARAARAPRAPRAQYGYVVLGESLDGPLSGLAALADQSLISADVRTVVRFEASSVAPLALAEAREHFVLIAGGDRVAFATMNEGEVHTTDGERITRIAEHEPVPVELASDGPYVAWLNRDAPGGRAIRIAGPHGTRTIGPLADAWSLVAGGGRLAWLAQGWSSSGQLFVLELAHDREPTRLAGVPLLGPSMGSPRMAIEGDEVLIALSDHVLAIDRAGRARRALEARSPIRAIAADARHIALIVGEDDAPWSLAVAPRTGGHARTLASFARRPYDRHPLVIARGLACTLLGDRVIGAPLE